MTSMKYLLVGTTNPGKFAEAENVLCGEGIAILGLKGFPDIKNAQETGDTFKENAISKAQGYHKS